MLQKASCLGMGLRHKLGPDKMYGHGRYEGICLKSEHERVESNSENSKQKPVMISMFTLFGRQVFAIQSESVDEQPCRDLRRDGSHGCAGVTAEVERSTGLESMEKETSIPKWLSERSPEKIVIDLEEPPSQLSASYVGRDLESKPSSDNGRCCGNPGFSDKGCTSADPEKTTKNAPSSKPRLVFPDLNEIPADESCPDGRRQFLQDLNCCPDIDDNTSGVEDPTPSPLTRNTVGTSSPASYTSCCTTENNSRIESRSSSPGTPLPSCRARLDYPETEALPFNPTGEEDLSETSSSSIKAAAESLVHISCNTSYQDQDSLSKPEQRSRELGFLSKPEPEYSYDSYELLNLDLTETSNEDYCVSSSKARDELDAEPGSKELGLKLRRGRRMKNFQKEILPGLVSLSRHEIREDINVLEAVLRSREYRKMQGKTGDRKHETNPRKRCSGRRSVGRRRRRI